MKIPLSIDRWIRSPQDYILLATAAFLLILIRMGLALLPFRTLLRILRRLRQPSGNTAEPDRFVWAVTAVAHRLPFAGSCLCQALALQLLYGRAGIDAELKIGVRHSADGGLDAHAWLEGQDGPCPGPVPAADFILLPLHRSG